MKKIIATVVIVGIIALTSVLLINSGCKGSECAASPSENLSLVQQVDQDLASGALLVDVRTSEEYAKSHAKDAVLIPLTDIQKGIYPEVAKDQPVYLYCRSGNRAGQAKTILEKTGFTNVISIGGLTDWQSQGGEVVSN